ncbi:MAG TPA: FtsX-like permease family protein [Gammaproteobacteria bacterium]|nr:FtsX-like permease family protein [Gammaproteobacteria bacterium]
MLRHALKLVWNRRRSNRLVVVEIAAAFVVTFVLAAVSVNLWANYRRPLGFDYENVWSVAVNNTRAGSTSGLVEQPSYSATQTEVLRALRALPRTAAVEPLMVTPFINSHWQQSFAGDDNRQTLSMTNRSTAEALQAIGVTLAEGRWFGAEDEGQDYRAVLVNRAFVREAFGPDADAIGRRIDRVDPDIPVERMPEAQRRALLREVRIVGVIDDFRQWGEFADESTYVISRQEPGDERGTSFNLLLKVAPGTGASFEEQVAATIESVAPGWVASITPWRQLRETRHATTLLPVKVAATVSAFFLALVVMGLIGVLWQDVVRRTQEIGLRRALGARGGAVRRQIQLEILAVGALGILIGAVVAIQFPLLELVTRIDWASAIPGMALAAALILVLVLLGALYPSWLAARQEPADALRYE